MSKTFDNSIVEEIRARLEEATHQNGYFVSLAGDQIIRFWTGTGVVCSFFIMSAAGTFAISRNRVMASAYGTKRTSRIV